MSGIIHRLCSCLYNRQPNPTPAARNRAHTTSSVIHVHAAIVQERLPQGNTVSIHLSHQVSAGPHQETAPLIRFHARVQKDGINNISIHLIQ